MTTSSPIDPLDAIENKIFVSFDESPDEPPMNIYPSRVDSPAPEVETWDVYAMKEIQELFGMIACNSQILYNPSKLISPNYAADKLRQIANTITTI